MNIREELGEEEIFSILSHPIRRRILTYIFENKWITFSILSKEWDLKTGPIYHHLSKLKSIVVQDELNQYVLNETGVNVCEWYLKSDNGRSTVTKIDVFTSLAYPMVRSINNNKNKMIGLLIISYFLGIYASYQLKIAIVGPFLLPKPDLISSNQVMIFNTGVIISLLAMYLVPIYIFLIKDKAGMIDLSIGYLLSNVLSMLIIIILFSIANIGSFVIPIYLWFALSQISQLFYLILNLSYLVVNHGISVEKGIIVILSHLYVILVSIIFII